MIGWPNTSRRKKTDLVNIEVRDEQTMAWGCDRVIAGHHHDSSSPALPSSGVSTEIQQLLAAAPAEEMKLLRSALLCSPPRQLPGLAWLCTDWYFPTLTQNIIFIKALKAKSTSQISDKKIWMDICKYFYAIVQHCNSSNSTFQHSA